MVLDATTLTNLEEMTPLAALNLLHSLRTRLG